jgi:hypothetical protein
MRLHLLRILLVLAVSTAAASAQVGIYGNFATVHLTDNSGSANSWTYGPGGGVYYDFLHFGPIRIGADLRGNRLWGDEVDYWSGLGGLRLVVKPPVLPFRAYVQGSAGVGGSKASGNTGNLPNSYSNKFQYDVFGGADFTVLPHIDWRVVELGYGRMSGIGNGSASTSSGVFTLSSGIVLRLPTF